MPGRLISLLLTLVTAWVLAAVSVATRAATAATQVRISSPGMAQEGEPTRLTGTISLGHGQQAFLQYESAGGWRTLETASFEQAAGNTGSLDLSFVPRAGAHVYRVVAKADGLRVESNEIRISTTSGSVYLAKARYYMRAYCPTTPLSDRLAEGEPLAGRATTRWSATEAYNDDGGITTTYTWEQKIEFRPGMRDPVLRAVALHECAHIVQYRRLVKGHEFLLARRTVEDRLYGGNGVEKQADCMAATILGTMDYLTYTRDCSAAQRKDAAAMWATYGKVHQAPSYTFTRDR